VVNVIVSIRSPGTVGDDVAAVLPRLAAQALLVLVQSAGYKPGADEIEPRYILPIEKSRPAGCVFEGSNQTP